MRCGKAATSPVTATKYFGENGLDDFEASRMPKSL
jgi:hypothetical protein